MADPLPTVLGARVAIIGTQRKGTIVGVAEYLRTPRSFLVEYVDGQGDLVQRWHEIEQILRIADAA